MNPNEDLNGNPSSLKTGEVEILNAINLLIREGYFIPSTMDNMGVKVHYLKVTNKIDRTYQSMVKDNTAQQPQVTSVSKSVEKITIKDFKEKADIPFRIKTQTYTFTANQYSQEAEKYFNKNVVGKCDMNLLIELTKAYYKDETQARPTLSNYFLNGIWEGVLKEYQPKNQVEVSNKSFTGERRL